MDKRTSQDAERARGVVDGEQSAPLLHSHRLAVRDAEAPLLHLRVVAVEVQVHDDAAGAGGCASRGFLARGAHLNDI